MTILVTGDRYWSDYPFILRALQGWHDDVGPITLLVHGACRGADLLAAKAAKTIGIPAIGHPADWDRDGRAAGPIRNRKMLIDHPDIELVIGFHDDIRASKGTKDMMTVASGRGLLCVLETHMGTLYPWTKYNLLPEPLEFGKQCPWCEEVHDGGPENCKA